MILTIVIIYLIGCVACYYLQKLHHVQTLKNLKWDWDWVKIAIGFSISSWFGVMIVGLWVLADLNEFKSDPPKWL